jgi:hypothetical protein
MISNSKSNQSSFKIKIESIITKEGNPEEILLHANNISRTVKFTLEKEKDGCLPFLDVQITRQRERLIILVYRKKTDYGRYLHYESKV